MVIRLVSKYRYIKLLLYFNMLISRCRIIVVPGFMMLFCLNLRAEYKTAEYRTNVHSLSRRDGLSNGAVNTISKDSEGYIWFGTWNGLNRYDGNHIVTFLPGSNSNSIHNHVIRELHPTAAGPIWMLTNKGVALYDNVSGRFSSYFSNEPEQINYENDIAVCHSDSYGTMASVYGRGIFRFDSTVRQFRKLVFNKASYPVSLGIKRIHIVGNNTYCITPAGKVLIISGASLSEILQLPLTGTISSSSSATINNHPFLLITQRTGAALLADLETREIQQLRIPDDIITSISVARAKEKLWVGTEKGRIYSFNLLTRKFEVLSPLSNLLIDKTITSRIQSIYETDNEVLWIGTDGNGVYYLKMSEFPNKSFSSDQLAYPIVRCILVNNKRDILVGTKGGGIDIFDSEGKHLRGISVKNGLSNNSVLSFHELSDGSVLVGTDGKGIDIISPDYRMIRNFPRDFNIPNPLNFASVYRILEDSDHRIYLGTSGYGVIMVEFDKSKASTPTSCEQIVLDKSKATQAQQKQIVYALAEEKPGIIWIGTRGLGVYRYNTITKRVIGQYTTRTHPGVIPNDDILSLSANFMNRIWAGSSNGIFNISPVSSDSVKVQGLNIQSALTNTSVHALQFDKKGNLWLTTNQGLSMVDNTRLNVRSFNTNDGLINYEYSDGASYFDYNTNRLFIGGTMGLDIVQTDEIKFSSYFPPVAINQLFIRNQLIEPGTEGVLTNRINHQNSLILNYDQNSLSFDVSALAFWGQERHRVSYRLKNFIDEWIIIAPNQPISFSNLEPGKYRLQIRVSDENGVWSKQLKEVEIIINPPFWKTGWAIAGYILTAVLIQIIIFTTYRRREARKKAVALQEFRKQKEAELQSYKIEFFTNVAHELRTPLTLITSHVHAMLEEPGIAAEKPRLLKIFNNSMKLQKLVLEIMQFRKLEKGKEPLNIQLTKPAELVREVISDFELLAQQRQIVCDFIAPNPEIVFNTDADKLQRIVTNLVSNSIKYNKPGGTVKTTVKLDDSKLVVEVKDNGVGIKPEYIEKVFEPFGISSARKKGSFPGYRSTGLGLAVTKGLIELLEGTIQFNSKPGEGTTFTCVFPDVHIINTEEPLNEAADEPGSTGFIEENYEADKLEDKITPSTSKPLILLVDDDPEILALLRDFLQADYNLIFAENGREAFDKTLAHMPDLVVSDVMMPEMDGIDLCGRLRENFDTSHLPLILLTAKAEIEDRISGLRAGADSYIPKPFHPEHLKVRIEKLLRSRDIMKKRFGQPDDNTALVKAITDPFFQKMISCIDENLDDPSFSSEKLCDKLAISKSSLYNKTKSLLGTTPHSLINQRRLSKAATLLKSTTMTVSEIIDQTGFVSRTHFYELFNKSYGCSPSDFRGSVSKP